MSKALFLDRDGVVNVDFGYVHRIDDFQFQDGIIPLCQKAIEKKYQLIIITNQSGIARGMYGHEEVHNLHTYMLAQLSLYGINISAIYYCPHHPDISGKCFCRKPDSLLFEKAIATSGITPIDSWMIGDNDRDLIPAKKLNIKTALYGSKFSNHSDIYLDKFTDMYAYL